MKCPICLETDVVKSDDWKYECPNCGWPSPTRYMDHFKEEPEKLDFFYRLFRYFQKEAGLDIVGDKFLGGVRIVMENIHEFIMNWIFSPDDLAGMVYLLFNVSRDGSVYEFRGVYTNPYQAEQMCDIIVDENESRQLKAAPHVETRLINHLYGSSMFSKLNELSKKEDD